MWQLRGIVALLCIFSASSYLTPLESAIGDVSHSWASGEIDEVEVQEALKDLGLEKDQVLMAESLLDELAQELRDSKDTSSVSHRAKRSLDGPLNYLDLSVDRIHQISSHDLGEDHNTTVISTSFNLGSNHEYSFILVGNKVHQIRANSIDPLNCATCTLTYVEKDAQIVTSLVKKMNAKEAYVLQVVLYEQNEDLAYQEVNFVLWKTTLLSDPSIEVRGLAQVAVEKVQEYQITDLNPVIKENSLSRASMINVPDGMLIACFQRNSLQQEVDALHLMLLKEDNQLDLVMDSEYFNNPDIRIWTNDLKLIKLFNKEEYMLVVATKGMTYIYSIVNMADLTLIQKIDSADPVTVEYSADILGSYLTLVESCGKVTNYIWEDVNFIFSQMFQSPEFERGSWKSVETASSTEKPVQSLVVAGRSNVLGFYHHVMPGMYEQLEDPKGIENLKFSQIFDLGRRKSQNDYVYFMLVKTDSDLVYYRVYVHLIPIHLPVVNDVTLCLLDLESILVKDYSDADQIDNIIVDLLKINEPLDLSSVKVQVNSMEILGKSKIEQMHVALDSEFVPNLDYQDYLSESSLLSQSYKQVHSNFSSPDHVFSNLVFENSDLLNLDLNIAAPIVSIQEGKFDVLSVKNLGDTSMKDILTNTLRVTGDQDIKTNMFFFGGLDVLNTTVIGETSTSNDAIRPDLFFDVSENNEIDVEFDFKNVILKAGTKFSSTLNELHLKDILTSAEFAKSNHTHPVLISGKKEFKKGLEAYGIDSNKLNGYKYAEWYESLLFKDSPHQVVNCSRFSFTNITVQNSVTLEKLEDIDIQYSVLDDIVRADIPAVVTGDITFYEPLTVNNLKTNSLNFADPEDILKVNTDQHIGSKLQAQMILADTVKVEVINGANMTDVARTDIDNTFEVGVEFDVGINVSEDILMDEGVHLAGLDPSEIGEIKQVYLKPVHITGVLALSDDDIKINQVSIGALDITNLTVDGVEDLFLLKDKDQILPNMRSIDANIQTDRFEIMKTLDNIDISNNVLYTTGNQDIDAANISFHGTTYFEDDVTISDWKSNLINDTGATIAGVSIGELSQNIFCDKDPLSMDFPGSLVIEKGFENQVLSLFDINVLESFVITDGQGTNKDLGKMRDQVVQLKSSNHFNGKTVFDELVVFGDFDTNTDITGSSEKTLLNKEVLANFEKSIVKKHGNFSISAPFNMQSITGNGILSPGGTFDGADLVEHLETYILLDDSMPIKASLESDVIEAETVRIEPEDASYFNIQDLADYVDNHLIKDSNHVLGEKQFMGELSVGGSIIVNSESNLYHPFGVNMLELESSALSMSRVQKIKNPVIMDNVQAKAIYTNEVNGIELANVCLRDENCIIKLPNNEPLQFVNGATLSEGLNLRGNLNSRSVDERAQALKSSSNIASISKLDVEGNLGWLADREGKNSASFITKNAVVKSDKNWGGDSVNESGQYIGGEVTFNGDVTMKTLDIKSKIVNEGLENEFDIVAILKDIAKINAENVFSASKTFSGDVLVNSQLKLKELLGTEIINGINLKEYMDSILLFNKDSSKTQYITESWKFVNGLVVTDLTQVGGTIDNLKVEDFVLKGKADTRPLPHLKYEGTVSITGDLNTNNPAIQAEIDSFFKTSVYINETEELSQNFVFTDDVELKDTMVAYINGIPTSTIIRNNAEEKQVILQDLVLPQPKLTVHGNLMPDTLNGDNVAALNKDVLRIDRSEAVPRKVVFQDDVKLLTNEIFIHVPVKLADLVDLFLDTLSAFTKDLLKYYNKNIIKPVGLLTEELYVASRMGFRTIDYLEEFAVPEYLNMDTANFSILSVDSMNIGQGSYMMKIDKALPGDVCNLAGSCSCLGTRIVNGHEMSTKVNDYAHSIYTFDLKSALFTLTAKYSGYSDTCSNKEFAKELLVEGTSIDSTAARLDLSGLSAEQVGVVMTPHTIKDIWDVRHVAMWEIGGLTYLVIGQGYKPDYIPTLSLYTMDAGGVWSRAAIEFPVQSVKDLTVKTFKIETDAGTVEVSHLYVVEDNVDPSQLVVAVYEWSYVLDTATLLKAGEIIQNIPSPGITTIDVTSYKPTKDTPPHVLLSMGLMIKMDLVTSSYVVFYQFSVTYGRYVWDLLPNGLAKMGDKPILKMKSEMMSDYMNYVIASEDSVQVYNYLPNQGIRLVSEYKVTGKLVDMAIIRTSLPRFISKDRYSHLIYIVSESLQEERITQQLRVSTKGKIILPEILLASKLGF